MDLSAYAAQRKQDEDRDDIAPGMPIPIPQQPAPDAGAGEGNPLASYVQQTRDAAAVRAAAVRQAYDKFGLDDAASAEHLAGLAKERGIELAPDAFLWQEGLAKSLALHSARDDMSRAPRLAGWAAEGGVNAIIADADRQNLSILADVAAGAGYGAEMVARGALPRMEVSAAAKQIATLRRALGDKNRSYIDILLEEAVSSAPSEQNAPPGFDQVVGFLDLLASPIDAAGRYARSRLFDETEEDLRPLEERGAYFANQLAVIEKEVREDWGSGRLAKRVAPKLDAIGEIEGAGAQLSAIADLMYEDPAGMLAFTLRVLGESAPGLVATVGGAVAGGPVGAAVATGASSYATSQIREFEEVAKELGYDLSEPDAALRLMQDPNALSKVTDTAHMYSLVVAAFDGASGGIAGKQLARSVAGNLILQTGVQMVAGGGGEALGRLLSDRQMNMVEVVLEMLAELPGGVVEVGAARGGIAVRAGQSARAERLQTQADQEFFEAVATVAKDSEARAKVPAKYREAVEAITKDGHGETLFVDAGRLDQLFQSGEIDPDQFAEATGITAEQVAAEAARGGDVQIATADFAAKIVGSDIDAPLRQHMRVDPSRMSAAEAREIEADGEQLRTEAEAIAEQAQAGETEFAAEIETARAEFETALIERGGRTADVAAVEAAQLAAVYQTLAARTGLSPAAMLRRFPMPDVQRATSAATVQPTRLEQGSDAFNRWFGDSIARDDAGQPITFYHGTASDVEAFRGTVWVSTKPAVAGEYARSRVGLGRRERPTGAQIMPVYIRLERPLDARALEAEGTVTHERFIGEAVRQAREAGRAVDDAVVADLTQRVADARRFPNHAPGMATWLYWYFDEKRHEYLKPDGVVAMRELFEHLGFDGIIDVEQGDITYGVLDPAQVKSIFNRGAYDLNDPRILHQAAERLPGLEPTSPGRVPGVRETATEYMRSHGMPIRHQAEYVKVDVARAKEIARLYDEMPATPAPEDEAETYAAYEALARETIEQYRAVERLGFTFEWITGEDPYASPREAIRDMQENGHLWVFPTTEGFGTLTEAEASHPLLQPTGIIIDGRDALVNDLFRIVHDVFGHGSEGAAFGPRGEENAWQAHVRMFSPLAARAMTAETRGQNSWVNYGPHGAHNRANPQQTIFADQKVGLLPRWVSEVGQAQDVPTDRNGEPILLRVEDFSAGVTPELLTQPGWFVVTGMREDWGPHTDPRNATANAALRRALDAHGLRYTAVEGMYKGEPQGESYLAIGNEDIGLNLGREFGQESILTNRGLEYSDGRPDTPHVPAETVTGDAAKAQDFYSVMPDGTAWSMGLDWSAPAEPLFQSAPPVESEAFKRWFGGSKVVDESGAPLVVYHGTGAEFDAFSPDADPTNYESDRGVFHFSDNRGTAEAYSEFGGPFGETVNKNPRVIEAYLSLQNPMVHDAMIGRSAIEEWDNESTLRLFAERGGHDGIIVNPGDGGTERLFVAFRPEQIKSVDNRGTFSPEDPRILYQSAPAPIYRSALADAVQGAKQDRAKGKDWQAILPKLPGVKQAELVWTGTVDWLAERRDDTVTKGELLAHLAENAVPLEEVVIGASMARWAEYTEQEAGRKADANYREFLLTVPALELVGPNRDGGARPFVYDRHYSIPNIVVTARTTDRANDTLFVEEVQSDLTSEHRKAGTSWRTAGDRAAAQAALAEAVAARRAAVRDFAAAYDEASGGAYTDEQVLDLAEFVAAAGTYTRTGARMPRPDAQITDMLSDIGGVDQAVIVRLDEAELARFRAQEAVEGGQLPYTPFEGGAEYELMAKRLLQRAVREGYSRLAWTPAYMQARRWNQAAQSVVERVMWAEAEGGGRDVDVVMHGGNPQAVTVDTEGQITAGPSEWVGGPLSAVLGSAAARVMSEPSGDIDNANITFPSSGYTVAYERHFKGAIEKLSKKLGGRVSVADDVLPPGEVSMAALGQRFDEMQAAMWHGGTVEAAVEAALGGVPNEEAAARIREMLTEEVDANARGIAEQLATMVRDEQYEVDRLEQYFAAEEDPGLLQRFQSRLDRAREGLATAEANLEEWGQAPEDVRTRRAVQGAAEQLRYSAVWQPVRDHMRGTQKADAVFAIEITDQMREALAEPFALFQGQRGSIVLPPSPGARPVISLFNGSDLSTVLHESGHYYLHMIEQLASGADAPEQLRADWATLRDWWRTNAEVIAAEVGTDPEAVHRYLDGQPLDRDTHAKVWRGLHEQFARGLEAYMLEGKAPSVRMRSIMASFAAWLKTIYARVRGELGVQIDDEVRAVFDRLYATDEEIAAYAAGDGALNRELAARLGAGERELDALARLAVEQQAEAQAYMLGIAGGAFRRQRRHDYRRRRSEIAAEVAAGLDEKPVYRALAWLSEARWIGEGETPEGLPAVKLAETELTAAAYDDETIRALTARGLVAAEGLAPDDFADFFGFPSGDAMVQALAAAPRREAAARQQVRERLRREFGDSTFEARKAAPDAMNGDKRGQQLDAELRVLTGLLPGGGRATTRRQAATIAAQTIRNMPVRRAMRSEDFLAAERRAGRRVQQALVRRDVAAAAKAKREQLFQHTLYVESRKVAELVGKAERKAKQLQRAGTRKNLAGEYLGAIDEVLETYDFRRISGKAERERGRLRAYLDMMAEQGRMGEVVIPQEVIDEAKRVPYKSLTVDRLRGVYDSLRNIEHTAREAHKLRTAAAERDIREAVAEIVAEMDENLKDSPTARAKSQRSYAKSVVDWYANIALNADTRLRQYGGWKMGAAYRHLKTEIDAAGVREAQMRHEAAVTLDGFVKRYDVKERLAMGKKRHYAELGGEAFTKWDLLSMALNMGNEENLNRLRGEGTPRPMSEAQIEFVKSQLDARDWKFVQDVWDYLDSFWPMIAERERRVTGVAPQRVEPLPVETPYGTLRGGYYPIKYDGELSGVVEAEQLQEQLAAMQAGRFGKAQTKNGHTKARVGSGGRVLAVDINVLFVHVNDVIHDLAFQEVSANTWRLLRQPELVETFRRKGRAADLEMLEIWVQDVAVGGGVGGGVLGRLALVAKNNFTVSRLALNAATVLLQATGVTHSIAMIGPKYMGIGLADYLPHMRSRAISVVAQSEFMANRARFVNPDYMEFVSEGQRAKAVSVMDAGMRKFAQYGLAPMQWLQFFAVDMPTWLGAHARALSEGLEGAEAVHYADRMVARAQGGTAWADRTAFERGSLARDIRFNGFMRLWSTLASYMMAKGNIAFEVVGRARKENTVAGYMAAATHLVLLFAFEEIVRGVLKGEIDWDDEDDKKDGPILYALKGGALSLMGVSPFIRDLGSALDGFEPGMYSSFWATMGNALTQVKQGELDEALRRSLINAVGLMAPVPSGQLNRIIDAATDEEGAEIIHYLLGKPK